MGHLVAAELPFVDQRSRRGADVESLTFRFGRIGLDLF